MAEDSIFDSSYVGEQKTIDVKDKSSTKEFLKNPISKEDIKKYGSSKPIRIVIRATIQHGKS